MKRFLSVLAFLFTAAIAFGQAKNPTKNDAEAKKILDAVSAKFKTYKAIKSGFSLKIENAAGKVVTTKTGTVLMKGTKYRISVTGQEIFCDGANVWTVDKASKETTVSKFDNTGSTITPQKLFTNFYDKDFNYRLSNTTATAYEIELTPIDKSKPFHKVILMVNKATMTLSSAKIFEKTGNRFTYTVSGLQGNANISDAQFVYNASAYPGYELVDLR